MIIRFLVDSSGSMSGEPLRKVHKMLVDFIKLLHEKNMQEKEVFIQMLSYNIKTTELINGELYKVWTCSDGINLEMGYKEYRTPYFNDIGCGPKNIGCALKRFNEYMTVADLLVIFTKGTPSDVLEFNSQINRTKKYNKKIIIFHGNINKIGLLSTLTDNIFSWDVFDADTLFSTLQDCVHNRQKMPVPPKVIEL